MAQQIQQVTIPVFISGGIGRYLITGLQYKIEVGERPRYYTGTFVGLKISVNDGVWLYFLMEPYNQEIGLYANDITNIEVA